RSIDFFEMKAGESSYEARNAAARRLRLDRNRNGILVVFDHEDERKASNRNRIHRFPEFAFAGGAVSQRNICDLILLERDILKLPVIPYNFPDGTRMSRQIAPCLSTAHGLQDLCPSGR